MNAQLYKSWTPLEVGDHVLAITSAHPMEYRHHTVTDILLVHSLRQNKAYSLYELDADYDCQVPIEYIGGRLAGGKLVEIGVERMESCETKAGEKPAGEKGERE